MKYLPFIATFALGLALSIVERKINAKVQLEIENQPEIVERSMVINKSSKPDFHLLQSENIPMESRHRATLRNEVFNHWANADPIGFLASWRNREWRYGDGRVALDRYAEIDPAGLLDYARTEGCHEAWSAYLRGVSPYVALELVNSIKPSEFPEGWWQALVEKGMAVDTDFPLHLKKISDPNLRKNAIQTVASSMLSSRRIKELISFISEAGAGEELIEDLANKAGKLMIDNNLSIAELRTLPEEFRQKTIFEYFRNNEGRHSVDPLEVTIFVEELIATGWVDGQQEEIIGFMSKYANGSDELRHMGTAKQQEQDKKIAAKLLDLANQAPKEFESIKIPMIINSHSYMQLSPSSLHEQIPDPSLRDRALAWLSIRQPEAISFIKSTEIKHQTREYLEWERQLGETADDPFATDHEFSSRPVYPRPLPWVSSDP